MEVSAIFCETLGSFPRVRLWLWRLDEFHRLTVHRFKQWMTPVANIKLHTVPIPIVFPITAKGNWRRRRKNQYYNHAVSAVIFEMCDQQWEREECLNGNNSSLILIRRGCFIHTHNTCMCLHFVLLCGVAIFHCRLVKMLIYTSSV